MYHDWFHALFLTVCDAYTCKLTKLRFLICIIRYSWYFFPILIYRFFSISQLPSFFSLIVRSISVVHSFSGIFRGGAKSKFTKQFEKCPTTKNLPPPCLASFQHLCHIVNYISFKGLGYRATHDTYVKSLFSLGTQVSFHRECWQIGLSWVHLFVLLYPIRLSVSI
jgi:hypothetical protein